MHWRPAGPHDLPKLAYLNALLIRDEGHSNPMSVAELEERMEKWLQTTYTAILFESENEVLGYALFQDHEYGGIHLRHFFVVPTHRRRGLGTEAFRLLCTEVLPTDASVVLDVLTLNASARAFWESLGFEDYARRLRLAR